MLERGSEKIRIVGALSFECVVGLVQKFSGEVYWDCVFLLDVFFEDDRVNLLHPKASVAALPEARR